MSGAGGKERMEFVDLGAQYRRIKPSIRARIDTVLEHGKFIMGPEVGELERELAKFCGAKHSIAVSSGTDALLVALMAWKIGPGDAVFLPAFTYTATAEVVVLLGATPVFVDVDPNTFLMDLDSLDEKLATPGLKPRVVLVVDLFGLPADYEGITERIAGRGIEVLADAAQSFGAIHRNHRVGALAPITATSFFPAKPLGCYGDGGAIFTDNDGWAEIMRSIRAHGQGAAKYDVARLGLNARLDTLQAAILLAKLEVFEDELSCRRALAATYDRYLPKTVQIPKRIAGHESAWAQYTIRVPDRDALAAALQREGIPTVVYYPRPMHLQPAYAEFAKGSLPASERLCGEVLSLPMHPYLADEKAIEICRMIEEHYARTL